MRRLSPFVVLAVAVATAVALYRSSERLEPAEEWKPVQPS